MILCALLLTSGASAQQSPQPAWTEVQGYVSVLREHVPWPSPENVVRDLRSSDDEARLKALLLLGLSDGQAHILDWSDTTPARVIDRHVAMPDQVQLTYAALGEDDTRQAIVAV